MCLGEYHRLVKDMRELRRSYFFSSFRMTPSIFDKLLKKVHSKIKKTKNQTSQPHLDCRKTRSNFEVSGNLNIFLMSYANTMKAS